MCYMFGYSLKQIAAACLFSGLIAAGVSTRTISSNADHTPTVSVSIKRTIKSDRLRSDPSPRPIDNSRATDAVRSPVPAPVGCEPPFSQIAGPAHADTVMRCLA
jgi:hypothetical protein